MVGRGVQGHGRAPLSGVVEAVLPSRHPGDGGMAKQDHEAAKETESGADPAGVQGEAERHQTLVLVSPDGEPDRRYDATYSWKRRSDRGVTEQTVIFKDKSELIEEKNEKFLPEVIFKTKTLFACVSFCTMSAHLADCP